MRATLIYAVSMENSPSLEVIGLFKENSDNYAKALRASRAEDYHHEHLGNWRETRMCKFEVPEDFKTGHAAIVIDWVDAVDSYVLGLNENPYVTKETLLSDYHNAKKGMDCIEVDEVYEDGGFTLEDTDIMENVYGYAVEVELEKEYNNVVTLSKQQLEDRQQQLYDDICRTLTDYENGDYESIDDMASEMYTLLVNVQREWENLKSDNK